MPEAFPLDDFDQDAMKREYAAANKVRGGGGGCVYRWMDMCLCENQKNILFELYCECGLVGTGGGYA